MKDRIALSWLMIVMLVALFASASYAGLFSATGSLAWNAVDDPSPSEPSNWTAAGSSLVQKSNIYRVVSEYQFYQGSHCVTGLSTWADYDLTAVVTSADDDGWGAIVRYQDQNNYYRFITVQDSGNGGPFRRLEKFVGGVRMLIVEQKLGFLPNKPYQFKFTCVGSQLEVWLDGVKCLSASDGTFKTGKAGFMTYANSNVGFSAIGTTMRTAPVTTTTTSAVTTTTTSGDLLFSDDFASGSIGSAWKVVDDANPKDGPSKWNVRSGALHQDSNIFRADNEYSYYQGTHIFVGSSDWYDYTLSATCQSSDDDGWGAIVRYQDKSNYYRFITVQDSANGGPFRRLEKFVNGTRTVLAEQKIGFGFRPVDLKFVCADKQLEVWIDGVKCLWATDYAFLTGRAGFMTYADSSFQLDNVKVTGKALGPSEDGFVEEDISTDKKKKKKPRTEEEPAREG